MDTDQRYMAAAIRLARRHEGLTGTNPSVACVLVHDFGYGPVIIGSGVTARGGRPHAEPLALAQAGEVATGATAYVTLEPCAHHGSTPPCAQTLIDAGVARVVTAVVDPDGRVNSKGHAMLRNAGVEVEAGKCDGTARDGLGAYLNHKIRNRPQVTLKLALSAEDFLGVEGKPQIAVTGEIANAQSHLMRARYHAIMVGSGTVEADDPSLTCRLPGLEERSPIRIVLEGKTPVASGAKVFKADGNAKAILVSAAKPESRNINHMPAEMHNRKIALPELLDDLGAIGILSVMVEGGAGLARSFLERDLVDELVLYKSQKRIGERGEGIPSPITMEEAENRFGLVETRYFGSDVMRRYKKL